MGDPRYDVDNLLHQCTRHRMLRDDDLMPKERTDMSEHSTPTIENPKYDKAEDKDQQWR
ncbi:hypothetical protein TIFTF001_017450 [Ficus carica]|uniref:Uncharacterized protein n=1 Tax=Ficus carica TaxID=3494 RepID=A0AA88A824_FICCA|nr:hypothetical protein TIFTF001_017450 [Ficus carica]